MPTLLTRLEFVLGASKLKLNTNKNPLWSFGMLSGAHTMSQDITLPYSAIKMPHIALYANPYS